MADSHDPSIDFSLAPTIDGDTVTILVGKSARKFLVHETPLRAHSRFFNAAMNGAWKESTDRVVKVPLEKVKYFTIYVQWIYTITVAKVADWSHDELAHLYLMASRLQDSDFQDAVIDCIIIKNAASGSPLEHTIDLIYSNTAAGDLARILIVDIWVVYAGVKWFSDSRCAILFRLGQGTCGRERPVRPLGPLGEDGCSCAYHQHGDGECYNKK